MLRADMVVMKNGRPVAVVEAEERPIEPELRELELRDFRAMSTGLNCPWALVIDPETTQLFRGNDFTHPVITVPTADIIEETTPTRPKAMDEKALLSALERWLHGLARATPDTRRAELDDFAREMSDRFTVVRNWRPGQSKFGHS